MMKIKHVVVTGALIVVAAYIWQVIASNPLPALNLAEQPAAASQSEAADDCKLTEKEIRELWVVYAIHAWDAATQTRDEAKRTRMTAAAVKDAENFCRQQKAMKPTPLPSKLHRLAR